MQTCCRKTAKSNVFRDAYSCLFRTSCKRFFTTTPLPLFLPLRVSKNSPLKVVYLFHNDVLEISRYCCELHIYICKSGISPTVVLFNFDKLLWLLFYYLSYICRSFIHVRMIFQSQHQRGSQIPQCICTVSHNATFCSRNVHRCAHFCYKMMHCGIFVWCIVGFVKLDYLGAWSHVMIHDCNVCNGKCIISSLSWILFLYCLVGQLSYGLCRFLFHMFPFMSRAHLSGCLWWWTLYLNCT